MHSHTHMYAYVCVCACVTYVLSMRACICNVYQKQLSVGLVRWPLIGVVFSPVIANAVGESRARAARHDVFMVHGLDALTGKKMGKERGNRGR